MIKEIVAEQRQEIKRFFRRELVYREQLDAASKFLDKPLIKVITGPRRVGKSTFAFMLLKDKDFAYLNFDDERLSSADTSQLREAIAAIYGTPQFIFLDEVQNLPNWELFVNSLFRAGFNLIVTGSNSKLLSKELATALTGRYIPIELLPFSFREFLWAQGISVATNQILTYEERGKLTKLLESYTASGGFPDVIVNKLDPEDYLRVLFDAILMHDVAERYNVRYPSALRKLGLTLFTSFAKEITFTRLKNMLGFQSTLTVQNYVSYIEEAFLVVILERFSAKVAIRMKAPRKVYPIDTGLVRTVSPSLSANKGRLMECIVMLELMRKGYRPNREVFYYKTKSGREVDFIIVHGIKVIDMIQVAFELTEPTLERELTALSQASKELNCSRATIISWDIEEHLKINSVDVQIIPLWKWLLFNLHPKE